MYTEFKGKRGRELYDIRDDPHQLINLLSTKEGRETAKALKAMLQALRDGGRAYRRPAHGTRPPM